MCDPIPFARAYRDEEKETAAFVKRLGAQSYPELDTFETSLKRSKIIPHLFRWRRC
jgi:hypothetical protein